MSGGLTGKRAFRAALRIARQRISGRALGAWRTIIPLDPFPLDVVEAFADEWQPEDDASLLRGVMPSSRGRR